jgi:hypothetical protein
MLIKETDRCGLPWLLFYSHPCCCLGSTQAATTFWIYCENEWKILKRAGGSCLRLPINLRQVQLHDRQKEHSFSGAAMAGRLDGTTSADIPTQA